MFSHQVVKENVNKRPSWKLIQYPTLVTLFMDEHKLVSSLCGACARWCSSRTVK